MLRSGWLLLFALLASELVLPAKIEAAQPKVSDRAELFSKSAVDEATQKMQEIQRRFGVDVVVETFPSIPENMQAPSSSAERPAFFRRWAEIRAADEGLKGIYVLICKNPGYLQIEPDESVARKAFTYRQRDALVANTLKILGQEPLGQKQFDEALLKIVNTIESNLQTTLGRRAGPAAPSAQTSPNAAPAAAPSNRAFSAGSAWPWSRSWLSGW